MFDLEDLQGITRCILWPDAFLNCAVGLPHGQPTPTCNTGVNSLCARAAHLGVPWLSFDVHIFTLREYATIVVFLIA